MSLKKDINFSLWCDFIERDFLENEFQTLIDKELIHGATSNPAIFQQAILSSSAYEQQINMLQANDAKKIYEELSITDIKKAATLLKPLHDDNEDDGFISLEVDPRLCDDIFGTFEEGARLHSQINYDNVMIKVPATEAGYPAMKYLTSMGIPVNATLVFSPEQAIRCAEALDAGIEESGKDTKSVISVFVSRFDRLLNDKLTTDGFEPNKLGIINATKCYHEVEKFENKNIRTLFASTGVKGDDLPQSYYIDSLIYPNTVNTAPLPAIKAWDESGIKEPSKILNEQECDSYFKEITTKGIDLESAYEELLKDGLSAFKVSFEELLNKVKL